MESLVLQKRARGDGIKTYPSASVIGHIYESNTKCMLAIFVQWILAIVPLHGWFAFVIIEFCDLKLKSKSVLNYKFFLCFHSVIQHFYGSQFIFLFFMQDLCMCMNLILYLLFAYVQISFLARAKLTYKFEGVWMQKKTRLYIKYICSHSTWLNWSAVFTHSTSIWVHFYVFAGSLLIGSLTHEAIILLRIM